VHSEAVLDQYLYLVQTFFLHIKIITDNQVTDNDFITIFIVVKWFLKMKHEEKDTGIIEDMPTCPVLSSNRRSVRLSQVYILLSASHVKPQSEYDRVRSIQAALLIHKSLKPCSSLVLRKKAKIFDTTFS
jgi:hypothetical protein